MILMIRSGGLDDPQVLAMLKFHFDTNINVTPPGGLARSGWMVGGRLLRYVSTFSAGSREHEAHVGNQRQRRYANCRAARVSASTSGQVTMNPARLLHR